VQDGQLEIRAHPHEMDKQEKELEQHRHRLELCE
jgi:hypothetical protein